MNYGEFRPPVVPSLGFICSEKSLPQRSQITQRHSQCPGHQILPVATALQNIRYNSFGAQNSTNPSVCNHRNTPIVAAPGRSLSLLTYTFGCPLVS